MTKPTSDEGLFVVDLRGIELPDGAAQDIARAVRTAALTELAKLDVLPAVTMSFTDGDRVKDAIGIPGLPWPLGLWLDPSRQPPVIQ